jgi:hypothetical protein
MRLCSIALGAALLLPGAAGAQDADALRRECKRQPTSHCVFKVALEAAQQDFVLTPYNPSGHFRLIEAMIQMRRLADAEALTEKLTHPHMRDPALAALAAAHAKYGDYEKALAFARRIDFITAREEAWTAIATAALRTTRFEMAAEIHDLIAAPLTRLQLAVRIAVAREDKAALEPLWRAALALTQPRDRAHAMVVVALADGNAEHRAEALAAARAVNHPARRAVLLIALASGDDAKTLRTEAIAAAHHAERHDDDASAFAPIVRHLVAAQQLDAAMALAKSIRSDEARDVALYLLSNEFVKARRLAEALAAAEAITLKKDRATRLGNVVVQTGDATLKQRAIAEGRAEPVDYSRAIAIVQLGAFFSDRALIDEGLAVAFDNPVPHERGRILGFLLPHIDKLNQIVAREVR